MSARMAGRRRGYVWTRERWTTRAGEWLLFRLGRGAANATAWLPVHRAAALAAPIGALGARFLLRPRRRAEANIARIWPEMPAVERRRLVAAAGAEFARLGMEYAHLDAWARQVEITVEGAERVEALAAAGRGAVIVTAHYGNWEAIRLATRRAGVECGIIYRAFNNRYLDRFTQRLIARIGRPVLQKGRPGMRALRAHLHAGGTALILVDQRNTGAPFLPFLGHPAETVTVAATLARATGAALLPAVARREAGGRRMAVTFEPEVTDPDPEAAMTEVNDRISAWIRACPEQWFWFHRRWRATRRSRAR